MLIVTSGRGRTRRKRNPKLEIIGLVLAFAGGASGLFASYMASHGNPGHLRGGNSGSSMPFVYLAVIIAISVIVFAVMRLIRQVGSDEADGGETIPDDALQRESDDADRTKQIVLLALVVAALAVGLGIVLVPRVVHSQAATERGAFVLRAHGDTVVVDRFVRTADTLRGSVALKGQPLVSYAAALGPGNVVRTLQMTVAKAGAAAGDPPAQRILVTMKDDSALVETGGSTIRVATKAGAVPAFGNAFALYELFTRRASETGGSGDYSYFSLNGAATIPVTVRPAAPDSALLALGGAQIRYRVDAGGRVLGGAIPAQSVIISRANAEEAGKITFGAAAAKLSEKTDYSAPPGAPYTAEEVSFKGPGGITLGGTLTIPKNARGPLPAALTITGSGQEDRDEATPALGAYRIFRQVADTLSRRGIAVLRLDDRGLGASTGNFATSTTADFADDIRAGLAYLRSRPEIDGNRLALIGHSEGGIIGPMVAATDPRLRAMVTLGGPGQKMIEMSMAQNKWVLDHMPELSAKQRDSMLKAARVTLQPENQTVPMLKFWMSYDPGPAARQVKAATLIMQGANDRQVPEENAEKLAALIRAGGNRDVTVRIFPTTDHLFLEDSTGDFRDFYAHVKTRLVSPVILGAMADWLALKLHAGQYTPQP
jgi:uncharacterized protein